MQVGKQKTVFFILCAVRTWDLTDKIGYCTDLNCVINNIYASYLLQSVSAGHNFEMIVNILQVTSTQLSTTWALYFIWLQRAWWLGSFAPCCRLVSGRPAMRVLRSRTGSGSTPESPRSLDPKARVAGSPLRPPRQVSMQQYIVHT